MEVITKSAEETFEFGRKIGSDLKGGEILALTGNLGSGKTTFVQGLAIGLEVEGRILSPTFILIREHKARDGLTLYHVDLYRIGAVIEDEVKNLGLDDLWKDPENIVVIEWAEKIKNFLPKKTRWISFETLDENRREISIQE